MALALALAALPVLAGLAVAETVVSGVLDGVGPGFVTVNGVEFPTAPRVVVRDQYGRALPGVLAEVKPPAEGRITLERGVVVEIQLVELPK